MVQYPERKVLPLCGTLPYSQVFDGASSRCGNDLAVSLPLGPAPSAKSQCQFAEPNSLAISPGNDSL